MPDTFGIFIFRDVCEKPFEKKKGKKREKKGKQRGNLKIKGHRGERERAQRRAHEHTIGWYRTRANSDQNKSAQGTLEREKIGGSKCETLGTRWQSRYTKENILSKNGTSSDIIFVRVSRISFNCIGRWRDIFRIEMRATFSRGEGTRRLSSAYQLN